jgi:hypothetical protein
MSRQLARISGLFFAVVLTAAAAEAGPITYGVSRLIGTGSVIGTVTTDGTIGVLTSANVIGWTLELNDGSTSFTLQGPGGLDNSDLLVSGSNFTASLSGLFFDFSATGFTLFQNPFAGSGVNWWCMEGPASFCVGASAGETVTTSAATQFAGMEGIQQVAAAVSVVPEPASLVLVGLGLLVAGRRLARKS